MLALLFIALPITMALYTFLLGRQRNLVLWAAMVTLLLEGYLCANLPLGQPVRLMGAILSLTAVDRMFLYVLLLATGAILWVAHWLHQGELPIPIGLFILGVSNAIVLLDDPIVISLLLQVIGLAIVLATVDRPQEPVGLLPISAPMAGLKYLITMTLAGVALLIGFLMMGQFQEMPQQVFYAKLALGLLAIGFGLGTAVVPFHLWFPDLAGHTSTAVTGLLTSLIQVVAMLFLGRFPVSLARLLQQSRWGSQVLMGGAVAAALLAALLASGQDRWKRLAAYAASYDVAVVLCAFSLTDTPGLRDGMFLAVHHGLALALLWVCIGVMEWSTGRDDVAGLVGVAYRMPAVALGLVVATLSLAGIPPLGGFVGRWALYTQALARGWGYLAGLLLAALFFLLAMVRALWPTVLPTEQTVPLRRPPWQVIVVIALLIVALLLLGMYPHPILKVLGTVAVTPGGR